MGTISSLWQGQAISVLCRAWQATKEINYLDAATGLVEPFDLSVERDGVLGWIRGQGLPWYEEYIDESLNHVLNGMLTALLGLSDFATMAHHQRAQELFEIGIESVAIALPDFDTGFWSWYSLPESGVPYIASMGYQALHIWQLTALAEMTADPRIGYWARRFESYARDPICRFRAAASMLAAKARNRVRLLAPVHAAHP